MEQKNLKKAKSLYSTFVNFFIKKGKAPHTKRSVNQAFLLLNKKLKLPLNRILLKTFYALYTYIEVKHVKMRRRLNIIPFSVRSSRRYFLVLKKFRPSLQKGKPLTTRLYSEILNILLRRSRAKILKDANITQAHANRSNTHYRWFF